MDLCVWLSKFTDSFHTGDIPDFSGNSCFGALFHALPAGRQNLFHMSFFSLIDHFNVYPVIYLASYLREPIGPMR